MYCYTTYRSVWDVVWSPLVEPRAAQPVVAASWKRSTRKTGFCSTLHYL